MNHTPGPWEIEASSTCPQIRASAVGSGYYSVIASVVQRDKHPIHGGEVDAKTVLANARLIAAAPSMLTALVRAKSWMEADADMIEKLHEHDRNVYESTMEAINNAIRQATQQ